MNKLILTLATLLLSSNVFASTLRIPLFIDSDKPVPAAVVNQKLKAVGAPLLPLYFEVSSTENGYEKVKALDAQITKSLSALGPDYEYVGRVYGDVPGSDDTAAFATCYTGNPEEVVQIVSGLTDSVYSDQLNIFGYKYKNQTKIFEDNGEEVQSFLNDGSKLWRQWTGKGDNILILASVGDGGDDVNESLIPRCK